MEVREYVEAHAGEFFASLKQWLAIPSISADPAHHDDVAASARWLADHLRATGFPTVEIWETPGLPAVFAQWDAADPGAPTVLVYGHHDVQPVEPLELWESGPFSPVERDGRLYGRGTADDKGQVLMHTLGLAANLATSGRGAPPVTVKLLIEGEEESGSAHFADLMRARRDRLRCDVVVISDTSMWAADVPSMSIRMRGMVGAEISLYGAAFDLHSGTFGGAVRNPLHVLADLLAGLHDERGRITLPGFYDRVVPMSDTERELFSRLPFDEGEWLATTAGGSVAYGEAGFSTLERIWGRPTAEINGMWGGHTGAGGKTIIAREAHAKLSFRLVADQDPAEVKRQLSDYVEARVPAGIEARVSFESDGVRPCFSPIDSAPMRAAAAAMGRAFGTDVLYTGEGGSGPEAEIAEILQAPLVFLGVGLDDDRIHAPNEKVEMALLLKGAEAAAYLWDELAAVRG